MKLQIIAAVLSITALVLGFTGCRSDDVDYRHSPYSINYLSNDKSVMDDVLKAAVRHKCLPQVMNDNNITCTSVQNGVVVKVNLSDSIIIIHPPKALANKIGKNEYNEWVEVFGQEIRTQLER